MLRNNSKDQKGCEAKEEGILIRSSSNNNNDGKYSFPKAPTSSSRQWSGFRNPRIVRVSRSFGGKDRHSKVCTIRGLRDRRIRLSVPTAIQLYDLQDKLKLGQPSKVIDWLLDVTKLDIDNLPPLQIPPGFSPFHQQMLFPQYVDPHHHYYTSSSSSSSSSSSRFCNSLPPSFMLDVKSTDAYQTTMTVEKTKLWDMDLAVLQEKAGSATTATTTTKGKWIDGSNNNSNSTQQVEDYNEQISSQKLLSMAICSSNLPNMMNNNNSTPYNNYNSSHDHHHQQQPSCLSLSSQFGNNNNSNGVFPSQLVEAAQASTSSSSSSSLFFTPYASYITNPFESHIHFLSSNSHALSNPFMSSSLHPFASQNLKPFPPPSFNLKQLFHAADTNAGGGAGVGSSLKDGAAGNS